MVFRLVAILDNINDCNEAHVEDLFCRLSSL